MLEATHAKSDFSAGDLATTRQHYYMSLLEMLINDQPMESTLEHLIKQIENEHPGALASILFLSDDGKHLVDGIGPSLPKDYVEAVNGVAIGEGIGSCGTSAATGELVIVEDISTHPYWDDFKTLALDAGLAACWSQPIFTGEDVLGTFAIYYPKPHKPTDEDILRINDASKLAQVVIERSRQKLQQQLSTQIFEHSKQGIMISNADNIFTYANPEACRISDCSLQEIIGCHPSDFRSGLHDQAFYDHIANTLVAENAWQGEVSYRNRQGKLYFVDQTISVRKVNGEITQFVSIFNDITEKKITQQELSKNTLQLELAMQSANMGYWEWNLKNGEFYYNDSWAGEDQSSILDIHEKRTTMKIWSNRIHPDDLESVKASVVAYLKKQTPTFSSQYRIQSNDKQYQWVNIVGRSLEMDDDGKTITMIGIAQDYNDVKNLTETLEKKVDERTKELIEAKQQAESANHAKSEFLAVMTHELRTPLNSIIGLSQLIREMELQPEQQNFIDKVCTSADILLELINHILDYSKLEANEVSIEKKPFSINQTIDKLNDIIEHKADNKKLSFSVNSEEKINSSWLGDDRAILQVLLNLVSNAIKFTQQGSVNLLIESIDETKDYGRFRFSVSDTGIGISEEKQQYLFKPFSQIDDGLSRKFEGTGLGLTISQRLIELMGGTITCHSIPNQGSTFSFELSFDKAEAESSAPIETPTKSLNHLNQNFTQSRVLLVEDNEFNQIFATALLKKYGIDPVLADNGEKALELIDTNDFDLVLMDVSMPIMDGITATQHIRQTQDASSLPIIAMTANVSSTHRQRALSAGMNGFIHKPVRVEELLNTLKLWLE